MNHIFVDFENVQEVDLAIIGSQQVCLTLLLGARQTKLAAALVEKLLEHAASVQLVRLASSGRNALDFTLAYYVGRAVMTDPSGHFHIVSKDAGFDPFIEHLLSRHICASRHNDFTTLALAGPARPPSLPPDNLQSRILAHLRRNTTNRPKRKKTLISHLLAFSGKTMSEEEVEGLVAALLQEGHLTIGEKDAVTYHL